MRRRLQIFVSRKKDEFDLASRSGFKDEVVLLKVLKQEDRDFGRSAVFVGQVLSTSPCGSKKAIIRVANWMHLIKGQKGFSLGPDEGSRTVVAYRKKAVKLPKAEKRPRRAPIARRRA